MPLFFTLGVDFLHRLPHAIGMYIRKTKTKTLDDGEAYFTYRLVESVREGQQVKQRTLLNLGKDFALESQHWPLLTARIEQLLQDAQAQQVEVFALANEISVLLETAAQRYSRLIVHKLAQPVEPLAADYQRVDINRVDAVESRSIGAETLALHAVDQLQMEQKLTALGFNGVDRAAVLGSIIGRMVSPGSESHTHQWLQSCSALGGVTGSRLWQHQPDPVVQGKRPTAQAPERIGRLFGGSGANTV
ncbi:hypothetical protein GO003_021080 [Methylicorpusculum oleiharenae]|uniref:hypothetical protein n=1 Tax=Methylicorpusculum oleiharenae TaxID=1338687 RepID=UPI001E444130|nr:hypothetical protein [Methylicorpusculum oleiharenae]MCD2452880.1 hypothetical protein [Methylicorpusculum oleiharenae]